MNATIVSFIEDFHELLLLCNDKSIKVTSLEFLSENLARTTHKKTATTMTPLKDRNVVIASFVTAYARLELFNILHKLESKVLYFDTDSVFLFLTEKMIWKRVIFLAI